MVAMIAVMPCVAWADEGMWLISTFSKVIYQQMRERGLELSAEERTPRRSPTR